MRTLLFAFFFSYFNVLAFGQIYPQVSHYQVSSNRCDSIGIYVEINGKYQLLEPLNFSGTKVNALGSALSYGIASTKIKHVYDGVTSPYQTTSPAHFRMYFGALSTAKAARYYMFSPAYTIRDFSIAKFEVKKKKQRILESGKVNIWSGTEMGVKKDEQITMNVQQIKDGVYDIILNAEPGEYCFVFNLNGLGCYNSLFDFTIEESKSE